MAANIEKRSQFSDFTVIQQLGSGSYGKVMKVQRKADNQLLVLALTVDRLFKPGADSATFHEL